MIKDSMILTFSKGIRGVLMLLFNMVVTRAFSANIYGTYKQINLIVNMLTAICTIGIPTTVSYFYVSYSKEDRNKFIGNTILALTLISILTSLVLLIAKDQISVIFNNEGILTYINIIALYTLVMILSSFLENLYISSDNAVLLGKIYVTYTFSNFIIMIASTVLLNDLKILMFGIVSVEIIRTIVMFLFIWKRENLKLDLDLKMSILQLKFALPLGVVALVQTINSYIDNLFITNNYTPDQYAAFANGAADIPLVGIVTVSIASVILPKMSATYKEKKNFKNVVDIWGDSCNKTAIIMFPIFWVVFLFSIGYIEIIYSAQYVESSTPIFMIYLMKFPLYCTVFGNLLIVFGRQKYIMYNSLIGIILNVILNYIFLKIFGMKGPAISTVIVQYVVVYLQLRQMKKCSKIPIRKLMPYKLLAKIFIIPGVIAIPMYICIKLLNVSSSIGLVTCGPIIYSLSFIAYYKLGCIDDIYIDELLGKFREKFS